MKGSMFWGALVLLTAALGFSLSAHAQSGKIIFEASLTPGLFPTPSESGFIKGSAKVYADNSFQISIVGAQPNETYDVFGGILIAYTTDDIVSWAPVSSGYGTLQLTTDDKGKGTASGWLGVPENHPYIAFALDDADNEEQTFAANRYVTGIRLE